MFTVCETIELTAHLQDGSGTLGEFMVSATRCRARILACCVYCDRFGTVVRLVTEDAKETARALAAEGIGCGTDSVVLMRGESPIAVAGRVGRLLALTKIPVLYSYSSWDETNLGAVVFKTADNARVARLLGPRGARLACAYPMAVTRTEGSAATRGVRQHQQLETVDSQRSDLSSGTGERAECVLTT
jgi:hypothetical protein